MACYDESKTNPQQKATLVALIVNMLVKGE